MLVWLLEQLASEGIAPTPRIGARIAMAAVLAFLGTLLGGPPAIRWLIARKVGEKVETASARLNELHAAKQQTPTMGGLFLVGSTLLTTLFCADLTNPLLLLGAITTLLFAIIGSIDDYTKLTTRSRGLSVRRKFLLLTCLSFAIAVGLTWLQPGLAGTAQTADAGTNSSTALPFLSVIVPLVIWKMVILLGSSNAVNLTDGLDGLASGCVMTAGTALTVLAYLAGHRGHAAHLDLVHVAGAGELAVLGAATVGATLGFLWYNAAPAQVFMGDTGSLPLGATLAYIALAIHQEWLYVLIGGVFVAEAVSVIAQVGSFKLTGRRVLACAPLHHHFQFRGKPETRIVIRFWIVSALLAMFGLGWAILKPTLF